MKLSTRRALAAIVASSCLAIPASASAMPDSPPSTTKNDAAALAQERYYSSYVKPEPLAVAQSPAPADASAALAQERDYSSYDGGPSAAETQERYYSSYGTPEPLAVAQSPAPSDDDSPWLPIALSAAVALAIVAASATQVRRLRILRRGAPVAT